jgi:CheY-like chemotaxis protein
MANRALIIESDRDWVDILAGILSSPSLALDITSVSRPEEALRELQTNAYDLVTLDLSLDTGKRFSWGQQLLADVRARGLEPPPIMVVSGTGGWEEVVTCINDYHDLVHHFARKNPWQHLRFLEAARILVTNNQLEAGEVRTTSHPLLPIFVSHKGDSSALRKLRTFLNALSVPSRIAEEEPKHGRSIRNHVAYVLDQCDAGIILKSAALSRSVLVEQGLMEERFPGRVIYLVEEGTPEGPMEQERVHARFSDECMDEALIAVARELKSFGYLGS